MRSQLADGAVKDPDHHSAQRGDRGKPAVFGEQCRVEPRPILGPSRNMPRYLFWFSRVAEVPCSRATAVGSAPESFAVACHCGQKPYQRVSGLERTVPNSEARTVQDLSVHRDPFHSTRLLSRRRDSAGVSVSARYGVRLCHWVPWRVRGVDRCCHYFPSCFTLSGWRMSDPKRVESGWEELRFRFSRPVWILGQV